MINIRQVIFLIWSINIRLSIGFVSEFLTSRRNSFQQSSNKNRVPLKHYPSTYHQMSSFDEPRPWIKEEQAPQLTNLNARDALAFKNKIPFTEDVYVNIKKVVETLQLRMQTKSPLALEDLDGFAEAIEFIIDDSERFLPPPRPTRPAPSMTQDSEGLPL